MNVNFMLALMELWEEQTHEWLKFAWGAIDLQLHHTVAYWEYYREG